MEDQSGLVDSNDETTVDVDRETRMGLCSWRPGWLQKFNSVVWFVVVVSVAAFVQVFVGGMTFLNLQTLETEFGLSSKSTGLITTGNDVAALCFVMIVSFFGDRGSKPKWIGVGCITASFGVLLFALPKLLIGKHNLYDFSNENYPVCQNQTSSDGLDGGTSVDSCTTGRGDSGVHVAIFFISQFITGFGSTPLQTLGPSYIDENTSPKMSPIYLGVYFVFTMLGPSFGMLFGSMFLKTYTDIKKPENIDVTDPRWIGAWWLGYVVFSGLLFISGIVIILFPKKIHGKQLSKREESIKAGHLPSSDKRIKYTFKGYIFSSFKLLSNRVLLLSMLAVTVRMLYIVSVFAFIVKFLILKFGVEPTKAGMVFGIAMVPSLIVGIMFGSLIMNRLKVNLAAKSASKICFIIGVLTLAKPLMFLLPGCADTNLAGVTTPYYNTTSTGSIYSTCNSACQCKESVYLPICGSDGKVYHSPCHAGCNTIGMLMNEKKKKLEPIFGNCSCLPPMENSPLGNFSSTLATDASMMSNNKTLAFPKDVSPQEKLKLILSLPHQQKTQYLEIMKFKIKTFFNKAVVGKCDRDCKNLYYFILLNIFMMLCGFIGSTPNKIMLLRCVPDNQRSLALGMQFVMMRGLAFLPGPILFGSLLDSHCISWGYDKCGAKTNCYDYNIDSLSVTLVVFGCICGVISAFLFFLAWWWYPDSAQDIGHKQDRNENEDQLL